MFESCCIIPIYSQNWLEKARIHQTKKKNSKISGGRFDATRQRSVAAAVERGKGPGKQFSQAHVASHAESQSGLRVCLCGVCVCLCVCVESSEAAPMTFLLRRFVVCKHQEVCDVLGLVLGNFCMEASILLLLWQYRLITSFFFYCCWVSCPRSFCFAPGIWDVLHNYFFPTNKKICMQKKSKSVRRKRRRIMHETKQNF